MGSTVLKATQASNKKDGVWPVFSCCVRYTRHGGGIQQTTSGGRISRMASFWPHLTNDQWVLDIVHFGHLMGFQDRPYFNGVRSTPVTQASSIASSVLLDEVKVLLENNSIESVPQ